MRKDSILISIVSKIIIEPGRFSAQAGSGRTLRPSRTTDNRWNQSFQNSNIMAAKKR